MPKPKGQKNGNNKAKHSKLLAQKKAKVQKEKELRKQRLRDIINKAKE